MIWLKNIKTTYLKKKHKIIKQQHIGSPTFQIVDMGYELELV